MSKFDIQNLLFVNYFVSLYDLANTQHKSIKRVMAQTNQNKLFAEFPAVSTEKWEEVITADLKGADYERKLVWRTGEGFNVRPYYRAENLEGLQFLGSAAGEFPYVRGVKKDNCWRIHQSVNVECPAKANAEALKILNAGVDALGFCICNAEFSAEDLDTLLAGIALPAVELTICGCAVEQVAALLLAKVEKEGVAADDLHVNLVVDPIVMKLSTKGSFGCCESGEKCFPRLAELVKKTAAYKGVKVVGVTGSQFHNAGSTIVQELAFTLAVGHEYLVKLMEQGLSIDEHVCCGLTSLRHTSPSASARLRCSLTL